MEEHWCIQSGPLGPVFVNWGNKYVHDSTTPDGPVLLHELTHVWQAKQRVLTEIFLYDAWSENMTSLTGANGTGPSLEQQAGVVEAWTLGAIDRSGGRVYRVRNKFAMGSPYSAH